MIYPTKINQIFVNNKAIICFYILIAILVTLSAFYFLRNGTAIKSDGEGYYAYLPTFFIYRTLDFSVLLKHHPLEEYHGIVFSPVTGLLYSKYPIGVAVLVAPFFFIAHFITLITSPDAADGYSIGYQIAIQIAALFYYLVGSFFLYFFIKKYFGDLNAFCCLVSITLATSLFHYTTFDAVFSHVYTFALVSLVVYITEYFWKTPTIKNIVMMGLAVGLLFLLRNYNVIYALFPLAYPLSENSKILARYRKQTKYILASICISSLIILPQLLLWKYYTNSFYAYSYKDSFGGTEKFFWFHPKVMSVLFSYTKGVFTWSPILALATLGLIIGLLSFRKKIVQLSATSLLILGVLTYIISSWWAWHFSGSYGHRGFIDAYPFFGIGLAILFDFVAKKKILKYITICLATLSVIVVNVQMFNYWYGIIPFNGTTKNIYWNGILDFPKLIYSRLITKKNSEFSQFLKGEIIVSQMLIPEKIKKGKQIELQYHIKNTGNGYWFNSSAPWLGLTKGKVALGVLWFEKKQMNQVCKRPHQVNAAFQGRLDFEQLVSPQQIVEVRGKVDVPAVSGDYIMLIELVSEGVGWFSDIAESSVLCYTIKVD